MAKMVYHSGTNHVYPLTEVAIIEVPDDWNVESVKTYVASDAYHNGAYTSDSFEIGFAIVAADPAIADDTADNIAP